MKTTPMFMSYSRSDIVTFLGLMAIAFAVIPMVFESGYWYSSILIPWLCLALAAVGQQIVMGYAGQLALGAAGFMAAGAGDLPHGRHTGLAVLHHLDDRQVRLVQEL